MKRGISIRRLWVFDFDGTLSPLVPDRTVARLHPASLALLTDLVADPRGRVAAFPGVELEAKRSSVAIHFRRVLPEARPVLFPLLAELKRRPGIRCHEGPSVAEVLFIPSATKSFGLRRLCRLLDFDSSRGRILSAGEDENDATAMRWGLSRKGTVFAVGGMLKIAGARYADGPASLARGVRGLQGIPGSVQTKTRRFEAAG